MAFPTIVAPVVTDPGGTGSTITPTLPTGHAAGDVIEIWVGKTGNITWTAPAGWTIKQQSAGGNSSTGAVGTLLYRLVLPGDSLPLASPVCSLGSTATRGAIAFIKRGSDNEGVHTAHEWLAFAGTTSSANPIRPQSVTTRSPENLITHYYVSRAATNAPEPSGYTQVGEIVISGTLVMNVAEKNVAAQATVLVNQDASPTSGARWVGMISCTPTPDYPYHRSLSSATVASGTSVTPALPTGTTASDVNARKDLVIATVEAAGNAIAIAPNTPADWAEITGFSGNTSGDGTTVRKYWALYDGTLDRTFTRPTNGELSIYLNTYHNSHQSTPIGAVNKRQNASSTTSTWDALTRTSTKVTMNATCVADGVPTFGSPTGWMERMDGLGMTCADQSFNATGSTASASFTLSSASPTLVGLIEIIGVASVGPVVVIPSTASLSITTFAPTVSTANNVTVIPTTASLTLSAFAPSVLVSVSVTPTTSSLSLSTFAPTVTTAITVTPNTASLTLQTFAPSVEIDVTVTPTTVALALSSFAPNLAESLTPATSTLLLSFFAPSLTIAVTPASQSLTLTVFAPSLQQSVIPSASTLTLTTFAPSLVTPTTVIPSPLSLTTSAFAPTISTDQGTAIPATLGLTLTTFSPVVVASITVTPQTASLTLTSFAPSLSLQIVPATGTLVITGMAPSVSVSGGQDVNVTPVTTTLVLTTYAPIARTFISRGTINIGQENRTIEIGSESRRSDISFESRVL